MIGTTVEHYEVVEKIGEGGMGEVYLANDTKLNRKVALKVLPRIFSDDQQRMARFQREAQVLASLNHPNIGGIHGLAESENTKCLVLELIEGETLAEKIEKESLSVNDALHIAVQIASALENAHEKGVIHRDLKPANIKVTQEQSVKVLDFGLAKAMEPDPLSTPDLTQSPTLTMAATQAGIILGTAAYMSPEQAKGKPVDRRSDIWSFGVVLMEMLSRRRMYGGETVSETMASVIKDDPDWSSLPDDLPEVIRRLLRRCLHKEPNERLQAIGEARIILSDYLADPERYLRQSASKSSSNWLPWGIAACTAIGLLITLFTLWPEPKESPPLIRIASDTPEDLFLGYGSSAVLSANGTQLAIVVGDENNRTLFLRRLDQLEDQPFANTEQAYHPFFSPDGEWIAFFTRTELKKVSASGGTPLKLCEVNLNRGGTWGGNDQIVFAPTPSSGLMVVPSAGGQPQALTELDEDAGEAGHRWPFFVPGANSVIFTSSTSSEDWNQANVEIVDLDTKQRKILYRGGYYGQYLPSGHLVFMNQDSLFSVAFDIDSLETVGSPAPVVQDIETNPGNGGAQYSVSNAGTLVYVPGSAEAVQREFIWVDMQGRASSLGDELGQFLDPRLSPDGTLLTFDLVSGGQADVWILDIERGARSRLTFEGGFLPVWSPDGEHIIFGSTRAGDNSDLYRKRSDGTGEAERLTESTTNKYPMSWSPDRKYVFFSENEGPSWDLSVLDLQKGESSKVLASPNVETWGQISPDGKWMVYMSNETERMEVYLRPFPSGAGKWQLSTRGGQHPIWSPEGNRVYYREESSVYSVDLAFSGSAPRPGSPELVFEANYFNSYPASSWAIHPDGERLLMMNRGASDLEDRANMKVILNFNWFEELNRIVPATR